MQRIRYALERGGAPSLEIAWTEGYSRLRVSFEGVRVGSADVKLLRRGAVFELPDGRRLRVVVERGVAMWVSGVPVPGTYADPWVRVKSAPIWVVSTGLASLWLALKLAPEGRWSPGTWGGVGLALLLIGAGGAMRRGSLTAHRLAFTACLGFFLLSYPRVSEALGDDGRLSLAPLPLLIRVVAIGSYVWVAAWILRKIAAGARVAREIRHPMS